LEPIALVNRDLAADHVLARSLVAEDVDETDPGRLPLGDLERHVDDRISHRLARLDVAIEIPLLRIFPVRVALRTLDAGPVVEAPVAALRLPALLEHRGGHGRVPAPRHLAELVAAPFVDLDHVDQPVGTRARLEFVT